MAMVPKAAGKLPKPMSKPPIVLAMTKISDYFV
jgi:hypothetical protein